MRVYNTPDQRLMLSLAQSPIPLRNRSAIASSLIRACNLNTYHSDLTLVYIMRPAPVINDCEGMSRASPIISIGQEPSDVSPDTKAGPCAHDATAGNSTGNKIESATSTIPTSLTSSTGLPVVERSQGHYLQLRDGRQILDACGGAGVTCIGHGNLQVLSAMNAEASNLTYIPWAFFDNQRTIDLQDWLIQSTGYNMKKVYLQSSGAWQLF